MFSLELIDLPPRTAEGRRIDDGFAILAENAHDLGLTDDWDPEEMPVWEAKTCLRWEPFSTPWKQVIHPR